MESILGPVIIGLLQLIVLSVVAKRLGLEESVQIINRLVGFVASSAKNRISQIRETLQNGMNSKKAINLPDRNCQPKKSELQEIIKVDVPGDTAEDQMNNLAAAVLQPVKIQFGRKSSRPYP